MNRSLPFVSLIALAFATPAFAQQAFPSPDSAGDALVKALGTKEADAMQLAALLGKDWRTYIPTGSVDRTDVDAFLAKYKERHAWTDIDAERKMLAVGADSWTLPVPLRKDAKGWHYDLAAGADEIRARRVGRNEIDVIEALRTYHDAQNDYAEIDRDGDGVLEYARKLVSTDGRHDGLYWADDDSGEISPLGPLFGDDTPKSDWHGYRYRILESQGASAPGGAYKYTLGDNMSRGFALVAWPVKYGDTGLKTFMISHDGGVFERDLGKDTDKTVAKMKTFDPDSGWQAIDEPKP
ncbi:hypothetical protein LF41_2956 [Lysobacter dokdonensis DS-58]|uniref:Uncharacterized protein n=1 Tax=Lysobacter dokdonensis DS-58 TaxID=1300345 RepID=A0A0A2WHL8_9GAMM|nr:DUF2950 domain-containing protein [Lysobacter dokdonensis]KGQ19308.1 hypothetical protein LF41_2956 [Lysobacter dokdonensis DS-58]